MKSFSSFSFGCRVNQAELENINREFQKKGFQYRKENSDFIIINSCAVTQKAERKTRQLIYQLKRKYPDSKIIVTGCAATLWQQKKVNIKGIILIPNSQKNNLVKLLISRQKTNPKSDKNPFSKYLPSGRFLLKIQDGCNRHCSYCIVPFLRGTAKSQKISKIIREIKSAQNIKEVILTAINTENFGMHSRETLTELIRAIFTGTKVARICFGSIHPWSLTDEFLDYYKKIVNDKLLSKRFVHFFHIPIQSGSDRILKLMNRGYAIAEIAKKINKLHQINPHALIATDIIVGFPGETEKDFQETYNFLKKSPISKFHIFRFSKREGTRAFSLAKNLGEVKPQIMSVRAKKILLLGKDKYKEFQQNLLGQTYSALFLEKIINNYQEVLLNNGVSALIQIGKGNAGEIKEVLLQSFQEGKLIGKPIE